MATIPLDFVPTTVSIDCRRPTRATREKTTITLPAWTTKVLSVMNVNPEPTRKLLLSDGSFVTLADEEISYLQLEAARRGISIDAVYGEELAAKSELAKLTPKNAELLRIADRFPAPQAWYDE